MRALKSGLKTAVVVAVSAGLISLIDSAVRLLTGGEAPDWLRPWGPVLVPLAGVVKGIIKHWEVANVESGQGA